MDRSYAQKIYLAALGMLQLLRRAGITLDEVMLRDYYARVDRWCAEAQVNVPDIARP